eukprot:4631927-Amphidinium_carterae.3
MITLLTLPERQWHPCLRRFKAGGYRSFQNYLSRAKQRHVELGCPWSDLLELVGKRCVRSCSCGIGPSKAKRFAANGHLPIDLPLFPDVNGQACHKQDVVDSICALAESAGMDTEQVSHITGHAFRVTGVIMLAARWSSPILYHYAREAPLMSITKLFKDKLSTSCFDATSAVEEMKEQLRSMECSMHELSSRVDSEVSQSAAPACLHLVQSCL